MWSNVRPYKCVQDRAGWALWRYASSWCYHDANSAAQLPALSYLGYRCLSLWRDNTKSFPLLKFRVYRKKRIPDQTPLRLKREHQRLSQVSWTTFLHRSMLHQLLTRACICGSKLLGYSGLDTDNILLFLGPLWSSSKDPKNEVKNTWEAKPCSQTAHKSDIRTLIHQRLCAGQYDQAPAKRTKHFLSKKHPPTETLALAITQKRLHTNRK